MPMIIVVLMLCLVIGVPVAAFLAGDRTRSIHRGASAFGVLHCLVSFAVALFCCGAAWASAATGSGTGIMEYLFIALQLPVFLLSKLDGSFSLPKLFFCLLPSSLLYGYGWASLLRRISPQVKTVS
jgi:hypothetical protein